MMPAISREKPFLRRLLCLTALSAISSGLCGCGDPPPAVQKPPTPVLAQGATITSQGATVSLTGEIRARVLSDFSFRFAGRIAERKVDVGDHVQAGQILAVLETDEQEADVSSATAGVESAEATLKQAQATFERQKTLIANGFTTQGSFDNAKQGIESAEAALNGARAALGTAQDQLANTSLRAGAPGVVTTRNAEAGQVVEAAQPVYTIAQDGPRDAVFEIYESLLVKRGADAKVDIVSVSDSLVKTVGVVREVAPAVDPSTGTVRVKVGIENLPPQMGLGTAVIGMGRFESESVVVLPWTAFSEDANGPAVWVVDPRSKVALPKPVVIDSYRTGELLLRSGVNAGDIVVTGGAQLLRPGETVSPQMVAPKVQSGDGK